MAADAAPADSANTVATPSSPDEAEADTAAGAVPITTTTTVVAPTSGPSDPAIVVTPRPTTTAVPNDTTSPTTSTTTTTTTTATTEPPVRSGAIVSPVATVGDPLSISIPAIGVESVLLPTGYADDGTVDVPKDPSIAGWFEPGPRPGELGPAVVMGHVDSRTYGPGVFYRLRDIEIGDIATIETTSGPVRFVVRSVEQFPKDEFPTDLVYGPVPEAALRLITCGGAFDSSVRSYRDNIVAFLVPDAAA
ncbi:MAG: sortase [Ilumatobacteraceae bacterium]